MLTTATIKASSRPVLCRIRDKPYSAPAASRRSIQFLLDVVLFRLVHLMLTHYDFAVPVEPRGDNHLRKPGCQEVLILFKEIGTITPMLR